MLFDKFLTSYFRIEVAYSFVAINIFEIKKALMVYEVHQQINGFAIKTLMVYEVQPQKFFGVGSEAI